MIRHLVPTVYEHHCKFVIRYICVSLVAGYSYMKSVQCLQYVCMYATLLQKFKKNIVGLKFEIADIMTSIMALISALNPSFITYIYAWVGEKDLTLLW